MGTDPGARGATCTFAGAGVLIATVAVMSGTMIGLEVSWRGGARPAFVGIGGFASAAGVVALGAAAGVALGAPATAADTRGCGVSVNVQPTRRVSMQEPPRVLTCRLCGCLARAG